MAACLSDCQTAYRSDCLTPCLRGCLSACLVVCLSACLCGCAYVCLHVSVSVCVSIYLCICLPALLIYQHVYQPIRSLVCLFIHLSASPFDCIPVCLSESRLLDIQCSNITVATNRSVNVPTIYFLPIWYAKRQSWYFCVVHLVLTSIAKLLLGLYISGIVDHVFLTGQYRSPVFIRVMPLKPPRA